MKVPPFSSPSLIAKDSPSSTRIRPQKGWGCASLRVKKHLPNAASRRFKELFKQTLNTSDISTQERLCAQQALNALNERSQLAFEMFVLGNYTLQEVATHLALLPSQVQQLIENALAALSASLSSLNTEREIYAIKCLIELHNDAGQTERVQELENWLALSLLNQAAFKHACRVWQLGTAQTPRLLYVKPKSLWAYAGLLACLLIAVLGFLVWLVNIATPQGSSQIRSLVLEDASRIELAPHTKYQFIHTQQALTLVLQQGVVYLDTALGRDKPLIIQAGELTFEGHQAAFELSEHASELTLSVGRGYVQVQLPDQRPSQLLIAGQKLRFDHSTQRFMVQPYPIEHIALWREGLMLIDQERLDRVVERLDRSLPGWSFIQDPHLAQTPISALFKATQPQHSLRALLEPWGAQIEHYGPWLRVIKRPKP